jgi:antitoxin ChpS
MHTTTLRKVGGSVMLAVPPAMLEILRLQSGDSIEISVDNGQLIARRKNRRYTLKELLAQSRRPARRTREDRDWVTGPSVGDELV